MFHSFSCPSYLQCFLCRQKFTGSIENKIHVYLQYVIAVGKGLVPSFSEPYVAMYERRQASGIIPTVGMGPVVLYPLWVWFISIPW